MSQLMMEQYDRNILFKVDKYNVQPEILSLELLKFSRNTYPCE